MAFFTRVNTNVPFLPSEECSSLDDNSSTLKRSSEERADQCIGSNTNDDAPTGGENNDSAIETGRYEYVVDRVLGVEV